MVPRGHWTGKKIEEFHEECKSIKTQELNRAEILDAKYGKINVKEVVDKQNHLNPEQKKLLGKLLEEKAEAFQGKRGLWKGKPVELEIKPDAKPFYAKPYKVPKAYEPTTKKEVIRLEEIGLLRKVKSAEWAAPCFIVPKKDGTVRFLTDFRGLNKCLVRKKFPLPLIDDIMISVEKFTFATALDLSMGYYAMILALLSRKYCVIILPWGLYEYTALPMGLSISSDVFQERMSSLFQDLTHVFVYVDDIIIIGSGSYEEHLKDVSLVIDRLIEMGMQVNPLKTSWAMEEVDYLGFRITRDGIRPQTKKVEAILRISSPKNQYEVRKFVGLVNFYKKFYKERSATLGPITVLTGNKVKFKWTNECEKAFRKMKSIMAERTLVKLPDYNKKFDVHTDASDKQIGGAISQEGSPLAYFSRKLNNAQQKYPVTERELLSIVETLKYFRTMLLGQRITVWTDHVNLTYPNTQYSSDRVLRQRLVLEEYGCDIRYIKGEENTAADALSRLPIDNDETTPTEEVMLNRRTFEFDACPVSAEYIEKSQNDDEELKKWTTEGHPTKVFEKKQLGNRNVWAYRAKREEKESLVFVPTKIREELTEWYHDTLKHPGAERLLATMRTHFNWPGMSKSIEQFTKTCDICQRYKITGNKKYGKLPLATDWDKYGPWECIHVDMVGPWKIRYKLTKTSKIIPVELLALTMIDRGTNWPEFALAHDKSAIGNAILFDKEWLCRYPRPLLVIHDNGGEFIGKEFQEMLSSYGIKYQPTTVKNPQANALIERTHLTMGDKLRTTIFEGEDWLSDVDQQLQATAWAIRSTINSASNYSPGQLAFGYDMIFQARVIVDWEAIKQKKRALREHNNIRENRSRIAHTYQVGDKVLITLKADEIKNKLQNRAEGPYEITKTYPNGTVKIQKNTYEEIINMRRIKPYYQRG